MCGKCSYKTSKLWIDQIHFSEFEALWYIILNSDSSKRQKRAKKYYILTVPINLIDLISNVHFYFTLHLVSKCK